VIAILHPEVIGSAMCSGRVKSKAPLVSVALAVSLALTAACSNGSSSPSGTGISVTLKDFHVSASIQQVRAGIVRFRIENRGPSTHEFVVVRTDVPAGGLPLGPDGLRVDEDSPLLHHTGELDEVQLGSSGTLVLRLPPGHYALICNLEGHYLGGMHLALDSV